MKMTIASTLFALALLGASTTHAGFIDTVAVGHAGNADDTETDAFGNDHGSVAYDYRIGKTEITNTQYVEFLNAVAATDTHGLYNADEGGTPWSGIIIQSGTSGTFTYSVKAPASDEGPGGSDYAYTDKPVVWVSWDDAARFANWMHNGRGSGADDKTEIGAYTMADATPTRNIGAKWFIPSEDEWYKAAYFDPDKAGGEGYWDYATRSDDTPASVLPSVDTGNSANFDNPTGSTSYPLTDVGAYGLSGSFYGTYDQNGNVLEWNESTIAGTSRVLRGGSWKGNSKLLKALCNDGLVPGSESSTMGFRLARVPEPSSIALLVSGLGTLLLRRRRKK